MVWNVDSTYSSDRVNPDSVGRGMDGPTETPTPDIKKENLRHIMKVVEQLNADIKYSVNHENDLRTDLNELRNAIELKEDRIMQMTDERDALMRARDGIMQAMNFLDPPEAPEYVRPERNE